MKKTLFALALICSFTAFSQDNWKQLPEVPFSLGGDTLVDPKSGDITITDDGRMYACYMQDNGIDTYIFVDEYQAGGATGWTNIYNAPVNSGLQPIKSVKKGNAVYYTYINGFTTSVGANLYISKVEAGSFNIQSSIAIQQLPLGSDFDFEMASDLDVGYLAYKTSDSDSLILAHLNINLGTHFIAVAPLIPGTPIGHFDMTTTTSGADSIFVAIDAFSSVDHIYLFKTDPNLTSVLPAHSIFSTGELFISASPIHSNRFMLSSNGLYKVLLTGYDLNSSSTYEFRYVTGSDDVELLFEQPENITSTFSRGATSGSEYDLYYLNNFSSTIGGTYETFILRKDINGGDFDTVAFPGAFSLANYQAIEHRMGYSFENKRFAASFWNTFDSNREYYISNNVPYLDSENVQFSFGGCVGQNSTLFNNISIVDENFDALEIVSISTSDSNILDATDVSVNYLGASGTGNHFSITGTAVGDGEVEITLQITDGWDTLQITLPAIQVNIGTEPFFNNSDFDICSNQGLINLFDYVDLSGGFFNLPSAGLDFENGMYDTDNSPIVGGTTDQIHYHYRDGACIYNQLANVTFKESPSVSITPTNTDCLQTTGSAVANVTVGSGAIDYTQWSSGHQNVTSVDDLAAGQYTFDAIDVNGCEATAYFEILVNGVDLGGIVTNNTCFGQSNGSIALSPANLTSPLSIIWSTGHSVTLIDELSNGDYSVTVTDATGCVVTETYNVTSPSELVSTVGTTEPTCGVSDGNMGVLASGGTSPYTYAWSNAVTGQTNLNVPGGVYSVTTTDDNGCETINTVYLSEQGSPNLLGNVTSTNCGESIGSIDVYPILAAGESIASVSWSNGETTEDIDSLLAGNYVCTLVSSTGCSVIQAWDIPIVAPEINDICVLSVDSATTTNLVVWEKVQPIGIAYYNIYRETSVHGNFVLIDTVSAMNESIFNDVVASPAVHSWRYKISAVNACYVESPLSAAHQTIHLSTLDNSGTSVTIAWNEYQGAAFDNYIISRYTDATDWQEIGTVNNTTLSFDDVSTPITTAGLDYIVEISLTTPCTAQLWKAQDFNNSRSNRRKSNYAPGIGTGDSNNGIDEEYLNAVEIYPNPASSTLTIAQLQTQAITIEIISIDGQQLLTAHSNSLEQSITIDSLAPGMYFVSISGNGTTVLKPFIKN